MRQSKEDKLIESGYKFSGVYYSYPEKDKAKERAAEYRKSGYFATVLTKTYPGRVYSREGYSVYIKPKPVTA